MQINVSAVLYAEKVQEDLSVTQIADSATT